jgi:hypothetical protein
MDAGAGAPSASPKKSQRLSSFASLVASQRSHLSLAPPRAYLSNKSGVNHSLRRKLFPRRRIIIFICTVVKVLLKIKKSEKCLGSGGCFPSEVVNLGLWGAVGSGL